ncbi:MAG TPA: ABC transporter substrate-binding protein, partial [Acidimicrobiia bacterium]|nr:ABC transporter substrate-binding protein [Acidimicrobiia bacterium]
MQAQGVSGMVKKLAVLVVALLAAACGSQAGSPAKSEEGLGESAPAAAAPADAAGQAAPEDQSVLSPEGTPTTIGEAVNSTAGAAGGAAPAAPGQKKASSSGPAGGTQAGGGAAGSGGSGGGGGGAARSQAAAGAPGGGDGGYNPPVPAAGGSSPIKAAVVSKGQGFTDTTIKIGATFPLSGAIGFVGQECAGGIDAYVKLVNSRGGIHGRKIELISYDDGFDPAQTVSNVKRLWEQDKVAMVFAFVVDSANEYVKSKNIPFFTFGGSPGG